MGRQASVHIELIVRYHKFGNTQRRNPVNFVDRILNLGRDIVRQAASEIAQDGIFAVTACAYNIRKPKLGPVGTVKSLKRLEFCIRQPIESSATLFGIGSRGEAGGTVRLVGEIRMPLIRTSRSSGVV